MMSGPAGMCILCLACPGVSVPALAQDRPAALVACEQHRTSLVTGHLERSRVRYAQGGKVQYYTAKFAGEDVISVQRGDEEGVLARNEEGVPSLRVDIEGAHQVLYNTDKLWRHIGWALSAAVHNRPEDAPRYEPRSLGLGAYKISRDVQGVLWRDWGELPSARVYDEWMDGELHVVTSKDAYGTTKYWIDSQRGWNPVRVARYADGELVAESRSTLKQFGEHWFPEIVMYFQPSFKNGKEPLEIVRIHSAEFNRPEHPQKLTPYDIGIDIGMPIDLYEEQMRPQTISAHGTVFWDGEKVVSSAEYGERVRSGELRAGPHYRRLIARYRERAAAVKATASQLIAARLVRPAGNWTWKVYESIWEGYTRQFIEKYKLDAEQAETAWRILKSCQEQAEGYLSKHKADFEKLDVELKKFQTKENKKQKRDQLEKRADLLGERFVALMKPIDDIFEKQLRPRLDKLPTRAQRAAVKESGQRKPAGKRESDGGGRP